MQQAGLALLALAACAALCPSEAILPIASSCCTEFSQHVSRRLLKKVTVCHIQRADGDCDLAAVILHVKRKRICVSPHSRAVRQWMEGRAGTRRAKGHVCRRRKRHSKRSGGAARRGGAQSTRPRGSFPEAAQMTL